MFESHPNEGETPKFTGSALIFVGESVDHARRVLANDIYATSGVWDLEKMQVIPVRFLGPRFLLGLGVGADYCSSKLLSSRECNVYTHSILCMYMHIYPSLQLGLWLAQHCFCHFASLDLACSGLWNLCDDPDLRELAIH